MVATMRGATTCLALLGLASSIAPPAARAQTRLGKPSRPTLRVVAGPTSLTVVSNARARVSLAWPPVADAVAYRLTRIENTGDAEGIIAELPASTFVVEGGDCDPRSGQPGCGYADVTNISPGRVVGSLPPIGTLSVAPTTYPHTVESGKLYTYRVWAIFAGPSVSPPSPPGTVRVQ